MAEFLWSDKPCANGHIGWRRVLKGSAEGKTYKHTKCEQCRKDNRKKHRKKDVASKIRSCINKRLKSLLMGMKRYKPISLAEEYLGCSIECYKAHIESQFEENWSWDNWGDTWQIDHIIECHKFDLNDPEDIKACFNYKNTRPRSTLNNTWRGKT